MTNRSTGAMLEPGAYLLEGSKLLVVAELVAQGVATLETMRRAPLSADVVAVHESLRRAAAVTRQSMAARGHGDVPETAAGAESDLSVLGTAEVAELLHKSTRQVRRIATSLGGWRGPGGSLQFSLAEVEAYRSERSA